VPTLPGTSSPELGSTASPSRLTETVRISPVLPSRSSIKVTVVRDAMPRIIADRLRLARLGGAGVLCVPRSRLVGACTTFCLVVICRIVMRRDPLTQGVRPTVCLLGGSGKPWASTAVSQRRPGSLLVNGAGDYLSRLECCVWLRRRRRVRRSSSVLPPQTPSSIPASRAQTRQSVVTGQRRQMLLASSACDIRGPKVLAGKNSSGSSPTQAAPPRQSTRLRQSTSLRQSTARSRSVQKSSHRALVSGRASQLDLR